MGRLDGRQADSNCQRPGEFNLGGFDEGFGTEVKKEYKSGTAAVKPDFFMGGCGPTVPTGPKRKLRSSWMANDKKEEDKPHVEHVPKPLKKWTPVAKRNIPARSKTHDGSMSHEGHGVRGGKKPEAAKPAEDNKEEKKEEEEPAPVEEPKKEEVKEEPPKPKPTVVPPPAAKPAWEPPTLNVRKELHDTSHMNVAEAAKKNEESATTIKDGKCTACASKDDEIAALKAEIEKLKAEKGELAATVKKSKGSLEVNKELKQEINSLKEQLEAAEKLTAKADPAHHAARIKLENKLNTLKMIMDGKVNKNDLDELKDHVDMLNMILNQDLKKEGMKNVWA